MPKNELAIEVKKREGEIFKEMFRAPHAHKDIAGWFLASGACVAILLFIEILK